MGLPEYERIADSARKPGRVVAANLSAIEESAAPQEGAPRGTLIGGRAL